MSAAKTIELAMKLYRLLELQQDELRLGTTDLLTSVTVNGHVDLMKLAAQILEMGGIGVTELPVHSVQQDD